MVYQLDLCPLCSPPHFYHPLQFHFIFYTSLCSFMKFYLFVCLFVFLCVSFLFLLFLPVCLLAILSLNTSNTNGNWYLKWHVNLTSTLTNSIGQKLHRFSY